MPSMLFTLPLNSANSSCVPVIEKYTKNARFCLICNYVSKIIPALQSRCTRFRFAPLHEDQVKDRVKHIADLEKCVPELRWHTVVGFVPQELITHAYAHPSLVR